MHLQEAVQPFDRFVRCIGLGPQTHSCSYDPTAPLHDRYTMETELRRRPRKRSSCATSTLTINAFFGWDFNSCEALRKDGVWYPIDFANPCPDSQVTSLHYHFPWLVKANIRWSVFCAATKRPMRKNARLGAVLRDRRARTCRTARSSRAYAAIADERFETERFEEFCAKHLAHLDEVAWEFFGTPEAKDAVRKKVAALFPAHEVEQFTELFWSRIQDWRKRRRAAPSEHPAGTVPPAASCRSKTFLPDRPRLRLRASTKPTAGSRSCCVRGFGCGDVLGDLGRFSRKDGRVDRDRGDDPGSEAAEKEDRVGPRQHEVAGQDDPREDPHHGEVRPHAEARERLQPVPMREVHDRRGDEVRDDAAHGIERGERHRCAVDHQRLPAVPVRR